MSNSRQAPDEPAAARASRFSCAARASAAAGVAHARSVDHQDVNSPATRALMENDACRHAFGSFICPTHDGEKERAHRVRAEPTAVTSGGNSIVHTVQPKICDDETLDTYRCNERADVRTLSVQRHSITSACE